MWKCDSIRPPLRWMNRADASICATAMVCRVSHQPGRHHASATGTPVMAPPSSSTAHTSLCEEIKTAASIPATHCMSISAANIRSVRARNPSQGPAKSVSRPGKMEGDVFMA